MKKKYLGIIFFIFVINNTLYAQSYRWDLVESLARNNFLKIETILKDNISTMSISDKRLVMNFTLNYSYGENTLIIFSLLQKYGILPYGFDLYTAINRNQPNTVIQSLLNNGVEPNGEILLLTMEKQRFDLAEQFIESGVDVNYYYPLSRDYADGMTPLLYASKWNNFELVELLLKKGANINAVNKNGDTALSISLKNGNNLIFEYLKEHGAVEIVNTIVTPSQNTGISSILDNQISNFQNGTYRLTTRGNVYILLFGNSNSGNITYTNNGRISNGFYRTANNNLTIIINGNTYLYRIDSNTSFSGNGEVWVRMEN